MVPAAVILIFQNFGIKYMKVADFIINHLADYGIDRMFVVYGAANGDLIDAFTRTNKTQYIAVMHEQGGGFAAEATPRSRESRCAIATSGRVE